MAKFGFIHDKLDIKLLVLYLKAAAPAPPGRAAFPPLYAAAVITGWLR